MTQLLVIHPFLVIILKRTAIPKSNISQGYSQSTLSSVAFFKDIGANAGILSGLILSHLRRPRLILLVGSVLCALGYLLMWASVVGLVPRPPVAAMCVYMLIAAQSQTFFNTADVVTAVENFPESRGTVIGIMKVIILHL